MLQALAMAGLSAAGSALSAKGAADASAKQGRLQMMEDYRVQAENDQKISAINQQRAALGRELLTIPEVSRVVNDQTSGSWVDIDGMIAAAERAGFNPVTFLNAGGLAAYAQGWARSDVTTTTTGHNAADAFKLMMPDVNLSNPSKVPTQSSPLSMLGGALTAGVNAFGTQYRADQSYDVQLARLSAAQAMQGMGLSNGNGFTQTLLGGAGGGFADAAGVARGLSAVKGPGVSDFGVPFKRNEGEVTNTSTRAFVDSTTPDAQAFEDRYGDIAQEIAGAANFLQDLYRNAFGLTLRDTGRAMGMNIGDYKAPTDMSWGPAFGRWWNSPTALPNLRLPGFTGSHEGGYFPFPGSSRLN